MIAVTKELLDQTSKKAMASPRKRWNHNFHHDSRDPIQRFLNAVEPGTYLRPHKHKNSSGPEIFLILRGRVLIIEFDDSGSIVEHIILDPEDGNWGVEIAAGAWHSFMSLRENSVLYELKKGPFIREAAKIFAEWSPEERTSEGQEFNLAILERLNIPVTEAGEKPDGAGNQRY